MDSIQMEKIKALNKYKRSTEFINNFILYTSTALTCLVLCSTPFWLPSLCSSIKAFVFVYLPNMGVLFFNPKCLFIVCNVIVIFLIGESKFGGSNSSPDVEIYDEYVKRSASLRRQPVPMPEEKEVKETSLEVALVEEEVEEEKEKKVVLEEELEVEDEKGDEGGEKEEVFMIEEKKIENEKEDFDGEEELGLPAEELNKKVEDFIAKINHQRRLEARLLISGNA